MGMESGDDEFMTSESNSVRTSAGGSSKAPRLFIKEMIMRNFKSYAGEQRVGPFHKVG
jgi:structural maintenance of chromosome 4